MSFALPVAHRRMVAGAIEFCMSISTGGFGEALAALLEPKAPGLSASTICRLKAVWQEEYEAWQKRDLSAWSGAKRQGNSSSIRLILWSAMRVSVSVSQPKMLK